jgi:hypothetical protein
VAFQLSLPCVGGFLKDPMLALVQTPHYFYSPDPFERNLSVGRNILQKHARGDVVAVENTDKLPLGQG